jgi:hypothetical protein
MNAAIAAKISATLKGRPKPPRTPEHTAKITAAMRRPETLARLRAAALRQNAEKTPAQRKFKMSPEAIAKISASWNSRERRTCVHCGLLSFPNSMRVVEMADGSTEYECRIERTCERRILAKWRLARDDPGP